MEKGLGSVWAKFKNVSEEETINLAGEKIIRDWETNIRIAEKNIVSAAAMYEDQQIEIDQELAEKKQACLNAYLDIDQADVATVELRKRFVSQYEQNIAHKQEILDQYENELTDREDQYADYIDSQRDIIKEYQYRIKTLINLING
jgi:vacuolar-type H+-ATPase subunit I/STV1